jgi:hypothetical protein
MAIMRVFRSALGIRLNHPDGKDPQVLAKTKKRKERTPLARVKACIQFSLCPFVPSQLASRKDTCPPRDPESWNVVEVCLPTSIRRDSSWVA